MPTQFLWVLEGKQPQKNMHNDQPCDQGFIVSIGLCFPSSWSFLGGHFHCFFFTEPKLKLKGYSVLYRQQRKGWSMSQHYWPGDMGLSKDKLCWRDDQAYSKLCLASSAIWALKPNPALSQGQTSGLYRLCCIWVTLLSIFHCMIHLYLYLYLYLSIYMYRYIYIYIYLYITQCVWCYFKP